MYKPSKNILYKYADVMVNYALNHGKGINPGDVVLLTISEFAKDFLPILQETILKAGGNIILNYQPDGIKKQFFELSNDEQLSFFAKNYDKGLIDSIDHSLGVYGETDMQELSGIDPAKIMLHRKSRKYYRDLFYAKEFEGKLSRSLCDYATQAMADNVGMSLEEYWDQIIKACFLDEEDPIAKRREVNAMNSRFKDWLNSMDIESVHIKAEDTDLTIQLGKDRKWASGGGANIPSFEIFTTPNWRGTNGYISFSQPLYIYGNIIKGIKLRFEKGVVIKASAEENNQLLQELIKVKNADKLGEFSMTDKRTSRITKFMGNTLYDENIGGEYGNMHIALGNGFKECIMGDTKSYTNEDWDRIGFNESVEHKDIITTTDRVITAYLSDGSQKIIYKDGMFQLQNNVSYFASK